MKLSVQIENSQNIIRKIRENLLDVGIIEIPALDSSIEAKVVLKDRLVPVCATEYGDFTAGRYSWEELRDEPFLLREKGSAARDLLDEMFRKKNMEVRVLFESTSNEALVTAAAEKLGIAVLSHFIVGNAIRKGQLREIPMEGEPFTRTFHIIWHKDKFMRRELVEALNLIGTEMGKWME